MTTQTDRQTRTWEEPGWCADWDIIFCMTWELLPGGCCIILELTEFIDRPGWPIPILIPMAEDMWGGGVAVMEPPAIWPMFFPLPAMPTVEGPCVCCMAAFIACWAADTAAGGAAGCSALPVWYGLGSWPV